VRRVRLSEIKGDLSRFIREAEGEEIVITRDGKPAGVLIDFGSEEEWLDYRRKMTRASCIGSNRRERACGRGGA
jgi:prevent-host-death family protein